MIISIPEVLVIQDRFLTSSSTSFFKSKKSASLYSCKDKMSRLDIISNSGDVAQYVAPKAEFRLITAIISVVIGGEVFYKSKDPKKLERLRGSITDPFFRVYHNPKGAVAIETPYSLIGRRYFGAEDLFQLASGELNEDIFYMSELLLGLIRVVIDYPRGFNRVFDLLYCLKCEFEWNKGKDIFRVSSPAASQLLKQFQYALKTLKGLGLEFKYERECFHILESIQRGGFLSRMDPSSSFKYPPVS